MKDKILRSLLAVTVVLPGKIISYTPNFKAKQDFGDYLVSSF